MKCPICEKEVKEFRRVWSDEPFTAKEALPGLAAWGGLGVERTTLHQDERFVHFKFDHDGEERLVEMVPDMPSKREAIHEHYEQMDKQCEHEGCTNKGWPGWTLWGEEEPVGWVCDDHAFNDGYCPVCHLFLAGMENFDFSPHGMCDDCWDAFQEGVDDDMDWFYESDPWDEDEEWL